MDMELYMYRLFLNKAEPKINLSFHGGILHGSENILTMGVCQLNLSLQVFLMGLETCCLPPSNCYCAVSLQLFPLGWETFCAPQFVICICPLLCSHRM